MSSCIISVRLAEANRFLSFLNSFVSFLEVLSSLTSRVACLSLLYISRLANNFLVLLVWAVGALVVPLTDSEISLFSLEF